MLRRQKKQKQYYDRQTKPLKDIRHGERVWILQQQKWQPAIVKEKMDSTCSYILETPSGSQYRRNRSHILQSNDSAQAEKMDSSVTNATEQNSGENHFVKTKDTLQDMEKKSNLFRDMVTISKVTLGN